MLFITSFLQILGLFFFFFCFYPLEYVKEHDIMFMIYLIKYDLFILFGKWTIYES